MRRFCEKLVLMLFWASWVPRMLYASSAIERRLAMMTEFAKELGGGDLNEHDMERVTLLTPFFELSAETDTTLTTIADSVQHELRMNPSQYHRSILDNAEFYCRHSMKREQMLDELRNGPAANSDAVVRALTGMIRVARELDGELLRMLFLPSTAAIVDGAKRPAETLQIKCRYTPSKYPYISQRLVTLDLPPATKSLSYLTRGPFRIRNSYKMWYAHIQQTNLRFTSTPLTDFTFGKHDSTPGGSWMIRSTNSNDDYLFVSSNNTVENLGASRAKIDIGRFRLFPTDNGTYFVDSERRPCAFWTLKNVTNSWDGVVTLNSHYPPSPLALWIMEPVA